MASLAFVGWLSDSCPTEWLSPDSPCPTALSDRIPVVRNSENESTRTLWPESDRLSERERERERDQVRPAAVFARCLKAPLFLPLPAACRSFTALPAPAPTLTF
jgi:hypothetical protein